MLATEMRFEAPVLRDYYRKNDHPHAQKRDAKLSDISEGDRERYSS